MSATGLVARIAAATGLPIETVRSVLTEAREPTDAMLYRIPGAMRDAREKSWIATWQGMIDIALKGG